MSDFEIDDLIGWHVLQQTMAFRGQAAQSDRARELVSTLESLFGFTLNRATKGRGTSFWMVFEASVRCLAGLVPPWEMVRQQSGRLPRSTKAADPRLDAHLRQADENSENARRWGFEAVRALFPFAFGPLGASVAGQELVALGFADLLGEGGNPQAWRASRAPAVVAIRPRALALYRLPSRRDAFDGGDLVDLYIAASVTYGRPAIDAANERRLRAAEQAFGIRIAPSNEPTFDHGAWVVFLAAALAYRSHQSPMSMFSESSLGPYRVDEQAGERALVAAINRAEGAYDQALRSCRRLAVEALAVVFSPPRATVPWEELVALGMIELPDDQW